MAPGNALPLYGNEKTMNLNSLVLANIQASPYFKHQLYELKTYHQVIDEIYYKVNHLEPWEKGSRKTAGQTGMCGGVRGVGTGGIVSSAYCLLYKLYTLKLTRKQVIGLCSHTDSPFIRALGLMYIRYTQPPHTFWEWFENYLDDEEEVDPKAGGGNNMTIGEMAEQVLAKLEWYGTLFPRIPVPIQKDIETKLRQHKNQRGDVARQARLTGGTPVEDVPEAPVSNSKAGNEVFFGEAERMSRMTESRDSAQRSAPPQKSPNENSPHRRRSHSRSKSRNRRSKSREERKRSRDRRERSRERKKESRRRSRSPENRDHHKKKSSRHRSRSRSEDGSRKEKKHHKRSRRSSSRSRKHDDDKHDSRGKEGHHSRDNDFQKDLKREMERVKRLKNGVEDENVDK